MGRRAVTCGDVTGRVEAEARRRAGILQGLIDSMRYGVSLFGPDGRVVVANRLAAGRAASGTIEPGMTLKETIDRLLDAGVTGDASLDRDFAALALSLNRSQSHRYVRPTSDGRILEITSDPLPDGGFLITHADITALAHAESEAKQRADLLQSMLDHCRHGMILFGPNRRIVALNSLAARINSLPEAAMAPGTTLAAFLEAQKARGLYGTGPEADAAVAAVVQADRRQPRRKQRTQPDGRIVEVTSDPTPDGGFVVTYTDITARAKAEKAAQERADLLRLSLESMRHGIALYGADRRLLVANDLFATLSGLDAADIPSGSHFDDIVRLQQARGAFGTGEVAERGAAEVIGFDRSRSCRYLNRMPDGSVREVISDPTPGGGFVITISDISPLARAEEEARHRAAMLQVTQDNMRHGIALFGPDRRLLTASRLAGPEMGLPPLLQRVGASLEKIVAEQLAEGIFGDDPRLAARTAQEVLALDRSRSLRYHRQLPDGRVIEIASDPTPDGGFTICCSNVTELVQAQAEAQQRAGILQVMLDNIRHGIALFDDQGRVVAANALAARMCGLTADEMKPGVSIMALRSLQIERGEYGTGPMAEETIRDRISRPWYSPDRYERTRRDGSVREVTTDRTPDGGYVRVYSDVTEERRIRAELKQAKDAAEAANLAKSRFLATMSHELRTPLNAVIGFSEAIMANPDPAAVREYIRPVHEAGRHLLSLIDDILDVARAETTGFQIAETEVDLVELGEGSVRVMRPAAEAAQVTVVARLPPQLPHVLADEVRLRQVLLNLLSNAVKFTPAGGTVTLDGGVLDNGDLVLRVTDTGIGIRPEDIPRAFEPFTQLDSSLARRFPGSGLGLYLSRALAEAQGAQLELHSEGELGTTAVLRFPKERLLSPQPA